METRIRELRIKTGMSQKEFAEKLSVMANTYCQWEKGDRQPDLETMCKIATELNTTVDYLLGQSEIKEPNEFEPQLQFDNIFPIKTKKFPLLGEIACGEPIWANEERESYISASSDIKADFCLKAKGDSMVNARILDGDIVFIRAQSTVENGEIAAVIINDEATLKRVYFYPEEGKLVLNPENSKYAPLVYVGEELNNIRILGKAIVFQSDII